ncbi:MAG TPA: PIN domain-containing protein [Bryobacterales bacterium]|nr:PIN domain-containing protein [Bryobacterales bacterium]
MAVIGDSGAIYALYDADDAHHSAVKRAVENNPGPIIIPAAILAELDYLLREFLGVDAELDFLEALSGGAYTLESLTSPDLARCRELIAKHRNLDLGLADAAVIAAAERLGVRRILTVDQRHFRAVRPQAGPALVLLPYGDKGGKM